MRKLVTVGAAAITTGAIIVVAAWLPLAGAAVAVLTRRMHDQQTR